MDTWRPIVDAETDVALQQAAAGAGNTASGSGAQPLGRRRRVGLWAQLARVPVDPLRTAADGASELGDHAGGG